MDFAAARRTMVDNQIRTYDVTDAALLAAFEAVPREIFLTPAQAAAAYADLSLPVVAGETRRLLLPPLVLARMLQSAEVSAGDTVLLIGGGSGYTGALLETLGCSVTLLEESDAMATVAREALVRAGAEHVSVVSGDFAHGHAAGAPYSLIFVEGAVETVPEALFGQLGENGRLACVVGTGRSGRVTLFSKRGGSVSPRIVFDAAAPLLAGFRREPGFVF